MTSCAHCRKRIHRQRNGEWYHNHNASVACYPGDGSPKRAEPASVRPGNSDSGVIRDTDGMIQRGLSLLCGCPLDSGCDGYHAGALS